VDDVGPERPQHGVHPLLGGQADVHGAVAGQGDGRHPLDWCVVPARRTKPGSDDERLVAGALEVLDDSQHRVGDAIDVRQERFRHDRHSHDLTVRTRSDQSAAWE
jgi:hypothetical protein